MSHLSLLFWQRTLLCVSWLLAISWLWQVADRWLHRHAVPDLHDLPLPPDQTTAAPHLTVIVPACNEQDAIEATLRSLLASRGLSLQILAVDDRSTDATGARMDAVAAEWAAQRSAASQTQSAPQHTLELLRIRSLPPGWLGKPHALAIAAEHARADWILFTDGDIEFSPDALARAVAFAQREQADHMVMIPDWIAVSRAETALQGAMFALTGCGLRYWKIADPKARDFLGVGAFNLFRRKSYEALGGFASLRMEVLEDVRIGWRVKQEGMRQRIAWGQGMVRVRWANGAWGVVRNLEKNIFALFRFRLLPALAACAGLLLHTLLPLVAIVVGGSARPAGILTYLALAAAYLLQQRRTRVPAAYVLFFPLASVLFLVAMLRSISLTLARGGVLWRGTLYPLRELRAAAGRRW